MSAYLTNIAIAADQLCNTIFMGSPDETLSSRAWRLYDENAYWYSRIPCLAINAIFFWQGNHCLQSYNSEVLRKHFPEELQ